MINIYTTDNNGVNEVNELKKECWINLTNPTIEEIKKVSKETRTDEDLIVKLMDTEELPRIEVGNNATLIGVDTPYVTDTRYKHKYNTEPLGIIINNDGYIITVSLKQQLILDDFKENKVKDFDASKKTKFLIQILLKVSSAYQKELMSINDYMKKNIDWCFFIMLILFQ